MERLYIDLHVIQTVPPSCVNRDDTGSPKTAVYGGVKRARVSSQAWKKAMRDAFRDAFDEAELGIRTLKLVEYVAEKIAEISPETGESDAMDLALKVINLTGVTTAPNKKTNIQEAKALFFISAKQARNLAQLILNNPDAAKKDAQAALNAGSAVDISLFGRMVADDPNLNTDACAQVAHAISTHRADNEYDYFTAVDDLRAEDTAGSTMIGTVEYNSATLYRYATLAAHELRAQLNDDAVYRRAVFEFARAFVTSMPTGKLNTFANRTLPDSVVIALRRDQPVNLVGAFESPIGGEGFAQKSIDRFNTYARDTYKLYGAPVKTLTLGTDGDLAGILDALQAEAL
ncbi:MAG: type I-E CRISPR-associated protein Cas7/Cse4/CasC [Oscillospiraceae bacterium]|jgi:CRISPR system Cascade subunit CasC|nr:type I-E CRISPR-associated protein Cas7/Cse4/CasC [Oscillospiraceae bacterium]